MVEDVGILVFKERVVVHRSAYQKVLKDTERSSILSLLRLHVSGIENLT